MIESNQAISPTTRTYEDITVGESIVITHTLTKSDLDTFGELTGDYNPIHWDPTYANKHGFKQPIAYGMLTSAYISRLIGMHLPGKPALWLSQSLKFLRPAYVGDTLVITGRVKHKSDSHRVVVIHISIANQEGLLLLTGESTVKVLDNSKAENN